MKSVLFSCRVHVIQDSCQSKRKKRKRHSSNDDYGSVSRSSAADAAEPVVHADMSTSLVNVDHSQHCHVRVGKKKKPKLYSQSNGHGIEDRLSSEITSRESEGKTARHCKEATNDYSLSSSQNLETCCAAENELDNRHALTLDPLEVRETDMMLNNPEHLIQPQPALVTSKSVNDSNMTASSSRAQSQVVDSNIASDEQQIKLSHSAKRRRRRHRGGKIDHRKDEGDISSDVPGNSISSDVGSSSHSVLGSNLQTQTSHSLVSEFGRTHIVFDSVNSDDESGIKAHCATPTCDKYDSGTCTAVADRIVNNSSDVETVSELLHENTASSGLVCSNVKKDSSAADLPVETKVRRPAKSAPFTNVQVYCRQRTKKSAPPANCMPCNQAIDTVNSPLSKPVSIVCSYLAIYVIVVAV